MFNTIFHFQTLYFTTLQNVFVHMSRTTNYAKQAALLGCTSKHQAAKQTFVGSVVEQVSTLPVYAQFGVPVVLLWS